MGIVAIGSCSSAADPLVRFLPLHEPIVVQFHCVIEIDFSSGEKKAFSHMRLYQDAVRVEYRQGTVFATNFNEFHYKWGKNTQLGLPEKCYVRA